jgi:transposase
VVIGRSHILPKRAHQTLELFLERVNHRRGEFACDEDGDGLYEVHVNTMEGFWSLLRSWLHPHRGISQEKLPLYPGFSEFVHNVRKQGKALLDGLVEVLVT